MGDALRMTVDQNIERRETGVSPLEVGTLCLVVVSPWLFGSVEAWARLVLYVGVALLTVVGLTTALRSPSAVWRDALSVPSLALLGMAALAIVQGLPMPERMLAAVDSHQAAQRAELLPDGDERVEGAPEPVGPGAATIAEAPELAMNAAAGRAAAWLLFLAVLRLGRRPASYRRFALVVTVNAVAIALFAVIQQFTWNGKTFWFRPSPHTEAASTGGPFISHGPLAAYLNIGLGLALGLLLATPRGERRGGP